MTKNFVTRALMITGLMAISAAATFAQAPVASKVRRVAVGAESKQPYAASVVAVDSKNTLNLSADQQTKISGLNQEVSALQAERAKLWSEYRAIKARPNFNDNMAATEAAPRMLRIVAINSQLAPIVSRQQQQLTGILNASQQAQMSTMVKAAKAGM